MRLVGLFVGLFCAVVAIGAAQVKTKTITVLAAISLRDALTDLAPAFEAAHDAKVEFVFGASGQLAAQARAGAAGDLFISAAEKQVDELVVAGVADAGTRAVVARNVLVLVVPAKARATIGGFQELGQARRIAVGEPKSVPAGMYAAQVLKHLDLESAVADKLVLGANVRQVADYVARGEADAGIIYSTDAMAIPDVRVVATAEAGWHEPITYPAVVLKEAKSPELARALIAYLDSLAGRAALARRGFLEATPTTRPAD